jgi:hypothetical protein
VHGVSPTGAGCDWETLEEALIKVTGGHNDPGIGGLSEVAEHNDVCIVVARPGDCELLSIA